jgi:hypothetical protein
MVTGQGCNVCSLTPPIDSHTLAAINKILVAHLVDDAIGTNCIVEDGLCFLIERLAVGVHVIHGLILVSCRSGNETSEGHFLEKDVVPVSETVGVGGAIDVN